MAPTTKSALVTPPEKSEHPELQANALQPFNCCGGDSLRNNKPSYGLEFEPKFTFLLSRDFKYKWRKGGIRLYSQVLNFQYVHLALQKYICRLLSILPLYVRCKIKPPDYILHQSILETNLCKESISWMYRLSKFSRLSRLSEFR